MKQTLVLLFLLLTITACQQPATLTTEAQKAIQDEVQKTLHNYYADIKASGLTAEFKYLDHSADFFWVPPGYSAAISYDSVAAILQQNTSLFKQVDNTFDTLRILPINSEYATYTGRLRSIMTDTNGKVAQFTLVETGLMVKRKDGWKLLSGQTSLVEK